MPINLQKELVELRRAILTMGAAVEQRVERAVESVLGEDMDAARQVRKGDAEIDEMEIDIEEECLRILALSHPVAGDLRFVLAVLRINGYLERIGDLARSIAKRALDLNEQEPLRLPPTIAEMARYSKQMLSDSIAALANEDEVLAKSIRVADERVDDLQKEAFAWVTKEIPRHVECTEAAIDILSIARKLERIADLSTNIAEDVSFLIGGEVVRHANLQRHKAGGPPSPAEDGQVG